MELGFLIKKIIGTLLMPLSFCLALIVLGVVLSWLRPRQNQGRICVLSGACLLFLLSWNPVSDRLLYTLEHDYPPLASPPNVPFIVVLGSKVSSDPSVPVSSQLSSDGRARIMEGIRLAHEIPNAKLVVSGYAGPNPLSCAELYAQVAAQMGVEERRIVKLDQPKDTEEESIAVRALVKEAPILLVTSASHMRRAMNFFTEYAVNATAAPTFFTAKPASNDWSFGSDGLYKSERAIYEYAGLAWQWIK